MSSKDRCLLTTKDFKLLKLLLASPAAQDQAFLRLLRRKLSDAAVVPLEEFGFDVAMVGSRADFTVDGTFADSRILAYDGAHAFPDLTLSVASLRGLALLGLRAGETIVVERPTELSETIRLDRVSFPGKAETEHDSQPCVATQAKDMAAGAFVISLASHRRPAAARLSAGSRGPEDDDPGPRAA